MGRERDGLGWLPLLRGIGAINSSRTPAVRTPAPQIIIVAAQGASYDGIVRRHRRARRYTLRIHPTRREAILSMPMRGNLADARDFAQRHGAWLAERLRKLPDGVAFAGGASLPLRGEQVHIMHRPRARGTVWLECGDDGVNMLCVTGDAAHTARRVKDYLKREARRDLAVAARHYAEALGVTFKRISVRDQSSRWGSCNSDGVLSFSWRLILAPPYVLDYLAAHEVAHLVEMNHSARFWRVVARVCPEMDRAKAWLSAHGNDLHRYGVGG
jgi:predicted metal-dependent hydrolase